MLHFTPSEFADRLAKTRRAIQEDRLDALLIFRQESMYWLTGFDTFGYVYFQCLLLDDKGELVLLCRRAEVDQSRHTSIIRELRVWVDGHDANPAQELRALLAERGLMNKRIGIELEAYGLTGRNYLRLTTALGGSCTLVDASELISRLRLTKTANEITYVRRAAELADNALDVANKLAGPGVDEAEILAAMHYEIYRGGGDDPANEFIIGSGPEALMVRYHSGRRRLQQRDQLNLEFAGVYRHYHACLMRTICIGEATSHHIAYHKSATDALHACIAVMKPGATVGDVFDAHARTFDTAGLTKWRLHACGYCLGTTFAPNWMDWPMIYKGNPVVLGPNMVFFLHMVIMDAERNIVVSPGATVLTTATSAEILSRQPLDLVVKQ
jgi:Xaa-Pro dipeptidase